MTRKYSDIPRVCTMAAKTDSVKRSHGGAKRGSGRHRRSYINARMLVSLQDETYRRWIALRDNLPQTQSHNDLPVVLDAFDNCRLVVACSSTY